MVGSRLVEHECRLALVRRVTAPPRIPRLYCHVLMPSRRPIGRDRDSHSASWSAEESALVRQTQWAGVRVPSACRSEDGALVNPAGFQLFHSEMTNIDFPNPSRLRFSVSKESRTSLWLVHRPVSHLSSCPWQPLAWTVCPAASSSRGLVASPGPLPAGALG